MKKILAVLALTIGLAGCVIDDGYGYYNDYYSPGYSSGYGYTNSYYTTNNYRYYDNNSRRWVTRSHADQKRHWDNDRKNTNRHNWNRKPDRARHDAKPNTPPRQSIKRSNQKNPWIERTQSNRRIEKNQNTVRRPAFNRNERPQSNLRPSRERSTDNRSESRRRANDSR
ncbi:hypothetical protein JHL22_00240 [Advenella sp. WQ 585]|uniref:Lipoprotein n=1 Tax=Advenella mandrilli TaxID=2800330 RepID=A0ABS1E7Y8_9BURK|nr:hypothetical protein [Advenella mandrilli]MBK1779644.1 hypothetical protein [Advenella mandrilli]